MLAIRKLAALTLAAFTAVQGQEAGSTANSSAPCVLMTFGVQLARYLGPVGYDGGACNGTRCLFESSPVGFPNAPRTCDGAARAIGTDLLVPSQAPAQSAYACACGTSINEAARQNNVPGPPTGSCGEGCEIALTNAPTNLSCNVFQQCGNSSTAQRSTSSCYRPQYLLTNDSRIIAPAITSSRLLRLLTCDNEQRLGGVCGTTAETRTGTTYCSCNGGAGPESVTPCDDDQSTSQDAAPSSTSAISPSTSSTGTTVQPNSVRGFGSSRSPLIGLAYATLIWALGGLLMKVR